jgi:hypothetical protein
MDDESLGLMASCRECGGTNKRTGKERLEPLTTGLGDGPGQGIRIRSEEYPLHELWATRVGRDRGGTKTLAFAICIQQKWAPKRDRLGIRPKNGHMTNRRGGRAVVRRRQHHL